MNIYCLCIIKILNFDSITKSKCWGQSDTIFRATLGLKERDKEEKGMEEFGIQWTWAGGDLPERDL